MTKEEPAHRTECKLLRPGPLSFARLLDERELHLVDGLPVTAKVQPSGEIARKSRRWSFVEIRGSVGRRAALGRWPACPRSSSGKVCTRVSPSRLNHAVVHVMEHGV